MADLRHTTDGPSPLSEEGYDECLLPDYDRIFISEEHIQAFANALSAPEHPPSTEDPLSPTVTSHNSRRNSSSKGIAGAGAGTSQGSLFITAQNDWAPVNPTRVAGKSKRRGEKRKGKRPPRRSRDETREGYLYTLLKWPLLAIVSAWVTGLGLSYLLTRLYIWTYEHFIAWRGKRKQLRRKLQATTNYGDWVQAALELDSFLENDKWKAEDEYAYYDHKTVKRVVEQMRRCRIKIEQEVKQSNGAAKSSKNLDDLRALIEACVKNNFVGVENSRLYSQTYYGTKNLVQEFVDEGMLISCTTRSFLRCCDVQAHMLTISS